MNQIIPTSGSSTSGVPASQKLYFQPPQTYSQAPPQTEEEARALIDAAIARRNAERNAALHEHRDKLFKVLGTIGAIIVGLGTVGFIHGNRNLKPNYQKIVDQARGLNANGSIKNFQDCINSFAGRMSTGFGNWHNVLNFFKQKRNWIECQLVNIPGRKEPSVVAVTQEGHYVFDPKLNDSGFHVLSLKDDNFVPESISDSLLKAGGTFYLTQNGEVKFGPLNTIFHGFADLFNRLVLGNSRLGTGLETFTQPPDRRSGFILPEKWEHSSAQRSKGSFLSRGVADGVAGAVFN